MHRFTAMVIFLILLAGLAVWALVATVIAVSRDGYRRMPTTELRRGGHSHGDY